MSAETEPTQINYPVSIARRFRLELWDWLRFARWSRCLSGCGLVLFVGLRRPADMGRRIRVARLNARAARICPTRFVLHRLERSLLAQVPSINPTRPAEWDALCPDTGPSEIAKAVILKAPVSPAEKGVLLIAFESHWMRLFRHADIARLARDYHLVIAPTWSPPHDLPFLIAARLWPGPLFHLISSPDDIPAFKRIAPHCELVPLQSSQWVNPNLFHDGQPVPKVYDIVMLANFAAYKRHFLLFRALRQMSPSTKVLLLGRRMNGRDANTIMAEAALYGVADRVTIAPGLPDVEMVRALRSARVSLVLSGNEGSCVAVVESMFADVPVGLFADALVGSKTFVNRHTGRLLHRKNLPRQLEEFIASADQYSPRRWVLKNNISCLGSTAILNDALRRRTVESGEAWTVDIAPHHWRPNPTCVFQEDMQRLLPAYREFALRYGCSIVARAINGSAISY